MHLMHSEFQDSLVNRRSCLKTQTDLLFLLFSLTAEGASFLHLPIRQRWETARVAERLRQTADNEGLVMTMGV